MGGHRKSVLWLSYRETLAEIQKTQSPAEDTSGLINIVKCKSASQQHFIHYTAVKAEIWIDPVQ